MWLREATMSLSVCPTASRLKIQVVVCPCTSQSFRSSLMSCTYFNSMQVPDYCCRTTLLRPASAGQPRKQENVSLAADCRFHTRTWGPPQWTPGGTAEPKNSMWKISRLNDEGCNTALSFVRCLPFWVNCKQPGWYMLLAKVHSNTIERAQNCFYRGS